MGFWGEVDATVDWCERNYVVSQYVAEWWNTLSSLPMVVLGVVGLVLTATRASRERRFMLAFACLSVVGVGSALFHMTLRRSFQLLDELPMLLANHVLVYIMLEVESDAGRETYPRAKPLLLASAVFQVVAYVYLEWYWVFCVSYAAGILGMWIYMFPLLMRGLSRPLRRLFRFTLVGYFGGFALWNIENLYCHHTGFLFLHSWWHIGAGYGTYTWIMFLVYLRCSYLAKRRKGVKVEVAKLGGLAPHFVDVVDKV